MAGFRRNRQERRIGRAAFLAQGRQHDVHDFLVFPTCLDQHVVECAGLIIFGRRREIILKPVGIKEILQTGVVVLGKAFVGAERVTHFGQWKVQILGQFVLHRHVGRHLAEPVHIVRETDQFCGDVGNDLKRAAHHGCARDLTKGAQVRQT